MNARSVRTVSVLAHDGRVLGLRDLHWALPEEVARDPDDVGFGAIAAE